MAKLTIHIGAAMKGLNSGLKSAGNRIKAFGGRVKSALSGVNGLIAGGVVAGILALGKAATQNAAKFEQTRVAFDTMLGSAEKAQEVLAKLTQFSTVTPFEPDEVYDAAKKLLAFGINAEELIPILKSIGDISAGTGKDFNELAGIFGKVFTKGKAQAEELNQMAEAGIPIIQTLGKMYNKTGQEIYEMASKGQISFQDIERAFQDMTGEGGRFGGMMQKQSETLNGVMSTLAGNVKEVGKQIAESWLPALKSAAKYTNDVAKAFQDVNKASKQAEKNNIKGPGTQKGIFDNIVDSVASGESFGGGNIGKLIEHTQVGAAAKLLKSSGMAGTEQSVSEAFLGKGGDSKEQLSIAGTSRADAKKLREQKLADDKAKKDAAQKAKEAAAAKLAAEQKKKEDEAKTKEQEKQKKIETKISSDFQGKLSGIAREIEIQKLKNQGLLKEAAIRKEIYSAMDRAKQAGGELSQQQIDDIRSKAGALFDLENPAKAGKAESVAMGADQITSDSLLRKGGMTKGRIKDTSENLNKQRNEILNKHTEILNKIASKTGLDATALRFQS